MNPAYASVTFAIERVTPTVAKRWLTRNKRNRKCSPKAVTVYANKIRRGEWRINGEAIKFGKSGDLLDGQHRLRAICVAGQGIDLCVIRGLDDEAFKTLDDGKSRTGGDCLYVLNYKHPNALAAAGRMLFSYEMEWGGVARSFRKVSNDELLATIARHPDFVAAALAYMRRPLFTTIVPHSIGMFAFYVAQRVDARAARQFFTELATAEYSTDREDHPIRVLRETLIMRDAEVLRPSSNTKLAWVVETWNGWHRGGRVTRLKRIIEQLPRFDPDPLKRRSK